MRNLKRALSLALASVMLLGMMVVGTSAASYPDVDENDNVEAIEVLNAVKVMIGDRGNFKPDAPVNRHEMAVIMAKLVLGNETADNYVGTHPFTDVASWADKYVAACYENGIVAGTSKTTFGGDQPLTAVQAAAFMLRALGYKDLSKGASDWSVPVTAMANQIRLFSGVASNPKEELDRNQVAQLALNTLKSPVVDLKDGTFDITSGDGNIVISGGSREYIVRSSRESYAQAINNTEYQGNSASGVGGYTIELGEHLYNGDLELNDDTDVFGRPARQWMYDGKEIGVYAKDELLRKEYSVKVTGRDLYDQLGSSIVNNIGVSGNNSWTLNAFIDGEPATLAKADITRSNTDGVLGTGKGVLTQVFVDAGNKEVYITVINTFLAIASEDYDSKNGEVDLKVYALKNDGSSKTPEYVKDKDINGITVTVEDEDIDVSAVKEDDMFLVTVADGKVQSMTAPEVLADTEISSFKKGSDVVVDSKTYDYADTAKYDAEVLEEYSQTNLKDNTYNIILDKYGYLIGIEQNEEADQYVFLTGMDGNTSDLSTKNADANLIFLDGTMKTVTVNVGKSKFLTGTENGPQMNTWCTYSVDSKDVYTLKEVATTEPEGWKVAQKAQDVTSTDEVKIDKKNVSLDAVSGRAYGNDDTVYLNVTTDAIKAASATDRTKPWTTIIDDVDSRTVGARNAGLVVKNQTTTDPEPNGEKEKPFAITEEIYTLYKDNGYIIAAVVIGEDDGVSKTYAYIHTDDVKRERYDKAEDEWTWVREAIVGGKIVDLTEVGGGTDLSELKDMEQGKWYELKMDADDNVKDATELTFTDTWSAGDQWISDEDDVEDAVNDKDTVILQTVTPTELTYKNGTLYTSVSDKEGFSVSPDVETVLCLSSDKGKAFDDCDDKYTGRKGLEDAIRNLDTNFKGELNVVFDKGDAVVIILVDKTGAKDEGEAPDGPEGYDLEVLALLDKDGTTDASGEVTFIATGTSKITGTAKREAIKAAYVAAYPVSASKTEVKYEDNKAGEMVYNVYVDGELDATYVEATTGVVRTAAVPTPAELWSTTSDDDERDVKEWRPLIKSGYLSTDAKFTPTGEIESDSAPTVEVTGINWITDFSVKVPGFFYVVGGSTEEAAHENCTIKQAYFIQDDGTLKGTNADHDQQSGTGKVDAFAIIPIIRSDYTSDTHTTFQIVFRGTGDDSGKFFGPTGEEIVDGKIVRTPLGGADVSVKDVLIITNKK